MRAYLYWFLVIISLIACQAMAAVTQTETWTTYAEPGDGAGDDLSGDNDWNEHGGCYNYAFSQQDDPCNAADKTLQFKNVIGDTNASCTNRWAENAGQVCPAGKICYPQKHRVEVVSVDKTNFPLDGEESWTGWRVWIPPDYPNPINVSFINFQYHCPPHDGYDAVIRIHTNGQWQVNQRRTLAGQPRNDIITNFAPVLRGTWNNFVYRVIRSSVNGAGISEFWYKGEGDAAWRNVAQHIGINSQSNAAPGCLLIHGLYKGGKVITDFGGEDYTVLYDDIVYATGANQLANVQTAKDAGACAVTPPSPGPDTGDQNNLLTQPFMFFD